MASLDAYLDSLSRGGLSRRQAHASNSEGIDSARDTITTVPTCLQKPAPPPFDINDFQFLDGDSELKQVPQYLYQQVYDYCRESKTPQLAFLLPNEYHNNAYKVTPYHFRVGEGYRIDFVLPGTEEVMLAACYKFGKSLIIVVQQKSSSVNPVFNNGRAAIVYASGRENGANSMIWNVWNPQRPSLPKNISGVPDGGDLCVETLITRHAAVMPTQKVHTQDQASREHRKKSSKRARTEIEHAESSSSVEESDSRHEQDKNLHRDNMRSGTTLTQTPIQSPPSAVSSITKFVFKKSLEDSNPLPIAYNDIATNNQFFYCALAAGVATESTGALSVEFEGQKFYVVRGTDIFFAELLKKIRSRCSADGAVGDAVVMGFEWKSA